MLTQTRSPLVKPCGASRSRTFHNLKIKLPMVLPECFALFVCGELRRVDSARPTSVFAHSCDCENLRKAASPTTTHAQKSYKQQSCFLALSLCSFISEVRVRLRPPFCPSCKKHAFMSLYADLSGRRFDSAAPLPPSCMFLSSLATLRIRCLCPEPIAAVPDRQIAVVAAPPVRIHIESHGALSACVVPAPKYTPPLADRNNCVSSSIVRQKTLKKRHKKYYVSH